MSREMMRILVAIVATACVTLKAVELRLMHLERARAQEVQRMLKTIADDKDALERMRQQGTVKTIP